MVITAQKLQYLKSHNYHYKLNAFLTILSFIVQVRNTSRALLACQIYRKEYSECSWIFNQVVWKNDFGKQERKACKKINATDILTCWKSYVRLNFPVLSIKKGGSWNSLTLFTGVGMSPAISWDFAQISVYIFSAFSLVYILNFPSKILVCQLIPLFYTKDNSEWCIKKFERQ